MYRNLQAEMARHNIDRKTLAEKTGMKYSTISDKLNGRTKFMYDETIKIKEVFFPHLPLEYLFEKNEEGVKQCN